MIEIYLIIMRRETREVEVKPSMNELQRIQASL